ncbi:MAG: transcriptional regulator [Pseudaminobacter sp.]|nr:transcriptional regulator [Pseudaminobacter sp.]
MTTVFERLLGSFRDYLETFDDARLRDFIAPLDWAMPERTLEPHRLACSSHLDRIVELASDAARPLAKLLAENRHAFRWGQTYTPADFGQRFIDSYGWLEVFGTRGHFVNDAMAGGFLILGPDIVYPDHHHIAEEIYIPLTGGTEWRMGESGFVRRKASEIIHHASNVNHAMKTGREPLLALYLWRDGPLAERSTVTGAIEQGGR